MFNEAELAPHSVEAEEAVLGSVLLNPVVLDEFRWLKPSDFFVHKHGLIFDAILTLRDRGEAIDSLTVAQELQVRKQLDTVGKAYTVYLLDKTPTYVNASTYAAIVESCARKRRLMTLLSRAATVTAKGPADEKEQLQTLFQAAQDLLTSPKDDDEGRLYSLEDIEALPDPTWKMKPWIPGQGLLIICGRSGAGKTLIAIDWACPLAQTGRVVYLALEGAEKSYLRSIKGWCQAHNVKPASLNIKLRYSPISLLDKGMVNRLLTQINRYKPDVVVIDTLGRAFGGGNPNDPQHMQDFVNACKRIQDMIQGVVIVVHHTRKGDDTFANSMVLYNSADAFIYVKARSGLITIEADKIKGAEMPEPIYKRIAQVDIGDGLDPVAVPIDSEKIYQTASDKLYAPQRTVLQAFEFFPEGAQFSQLVDVTEMAKGQLHRTLHELKRLGFVQQAAQREMYQITHAGAEKVGLPKTASETEFSNPVLSENKSENSATRTPSTKTREFSSSHSNQGSKTKSIKGSENGENLRTENSQGYLIPPRTPYQ